MMTMNSLSVQSAVFWCPSHSFFFLSVFHWVAWRRRNTLATAKGWLKLTWDEEGSFEESM